MGGDWDKAPAGSLLERRAPKKNAPASFLAGACFVSVLRYTPLCSKSRSFKPD
jgi:hypothetical protein